MQTAEQIESRVHQLLYHFVSDELLPLTELNPAAFWQDMACLVADLAPRNRQLLATRDALQARIDNWHIAHREQAFDVEAYTEFLRSIGYLLPEPEPFSISTVNVDGELATLAGPQLVVPLKNARFALNAANARWGSLYDALYGTDMISPDGELASGSNYNPIRGACVIKAARDFLDEIFPLVKGSHRDAVCYTVHVNQLQVTLADGRIGGLKEPAQLLGLTGDQCEPQSIVLKNHGLHIEIEFYRGGRNGSTDPAGIDDIQIEAALTTIMDCEDSVAAVDAEDKIDVYRNWLGLIRGDLSCDLIKNGETLSRKLNKDKIVSGSDGRTIRLHGRSLMLIRHVGHLMTTELMRDAQGNDIPEGIIDAIVTALIASIDLHQSGQIRNSRTGSIYIVKPKMHGPEEVAFSCELFERVEALLQLPRNTLKLGIMDEERRTTVNLRACIYAARERLVFINTGFLDRTGDEIHTSMWAGAFMPKQDIKSQPCITAYEDSNVDAGLACGLPGRAQIGKGMWPMPDEMAQMMIAKIAHPLAGASTAWVPSPTAATLHALHYHRVDVVQQQARIRDRAPVQLQDILTPPLLREELDAATIARELENNVQGILGYVVRWVEQGVGCSKVPDINNVGLMEDRATLRISSQHIANWLLHGLCSEAQVRATLRRMAQVVDSQNTGDPDYRAMAPDCDNSLAFEAASELIFNGLNQPNGYTEPLLHHYRQLAKQR